MGNVKLLIKNIALIVSGTVVLAFGTAVFIIPFELVAGGISGFSIVINKASGGALSVNLLITFFTWALFVLGIFTLGKDFAVKTLLSSVIYPIGISLFGRLADSGALNLANSSYPQLAVLLSALFGGVLVKNCLLCVIFCRPCRALHEEVYKMHKNSIKIHP